MATKKIIELAASGANLQDIDFIEGHKDGSLESSKFSGLQVRAVEKAEREEQDDIIEAAVGLDEDGSLIPFSGTYFIDGSGSIVEALEKLDASIGEDFMMKPMYDPNGKEADAFNMDSMSEGTVNKILTTQNQSILGVKNFVNVPQCDTAPSLPNSLTNKEYVDTLLDDVGDMKKAVYDPNGVEADAFDMDNMVEGTTNKILTNTEQDIKGVKNFENFPNLPDANPSQDKQAANKKYVDYAVSGAKTSTSATIEGGVAASGTLPNVNNTNKYIEVELKNVENPSKVVLGSHAGKIFWSGTAAQYAAISPKDNNTVYYVFE